MGRFQPVTPVLKAAIGNVCLPAGCLRQKPTQSGSSGGLSTRVDIDLGWRATIKQTRKGGGMSDGVESERSEPTESGEVGGRMHIHKPKAVARLGEFLSEIAVISVGILIALGAEQAVEAMRWTEKVQASRREIFGEIRQDAAYFAFRVAAADCVVRRLDELNTITESVARRETVLPVNLVGLHLGNLLSDNAWQNARAEQTLTHFPKAELERLSDFYAQEENIKTWMSDDETVWSSLRILEGDPNRLSSADVALLRDRLQQARIHEFLIALNAKEELERARAVGVAIPQADRSDVAVSCAPLKRTPPGALMGRP
jgi:hypothetical protein